MPIFSEIKITLDAREVAGSLYQGNDVPQDMISETEKAVDLARELWEPIVIYDWIEVLAVDGELVRFESQYLDRLIDLNVGPHADLLTRAEFALVSVQSIGSKLDEQVRKLNQTGECLMGYLLDSAGVVALSKVGAVARRFAEKEAENRGWGVGASLSPGSLAGWSLSEQINLCSLLPLDEAGIQLNAYGVLNPFKSASGLIGIGPVYKSKKVGSICQFCGHADTCWRRRDSEHFNE